MKKVLLATTVLAMTATVAAAEVTLSGNGRMGVVYTGGAATDKLQFSSRVRATISMSSETDGGLAFGGSFGVHDAGAASSGGAGSIYISGAFGKLSMGDVVGAAENVVGDLPEIGFTDIAANDTPFITGDGKLTGANNPVALYTYSMDAITVSLSMNDGSKPAVAGSVSPAGVVLVGAPVNGTREYALGAKYSIDAYSFGIGYEVSNPVVGVNDKWLWLSGSGTFSGATLTAIYGDGSGASNGKTYLGLGASYTMDALTVKAMYSQAKPAVGAKLNSYGIGAEYNLGGGATLAGGFSDNNVVGSKPVADLGVKFSF